MGAIRKGKALKKVEPPPASKPGTYVHNACLYTGIQVCIYLLHTYNYHIAGNFQGYYFRKFWKFQNILQNLDGTTET